MPTPISLDRFRTETARLIAETPTPETRLGLAVSGGPDSLALLTLAAEAYPTAIAAATVDHGLRPEAAVEAQHVAEICAQLNVPHAILSPTEPIVGNIQSSARTARYALLEAWRESEKLGWIATAHQADDQLETVLMRLMRGSGVDGLSAIRPVNGVIIRPLLGFRKAELVAHVASCGLDAINDPSNQDRTFDRIRLREALQDFPDFDPALITRSVEATRDAAEALQWLCERETKVHVEGRDNDVILTRTDYPKELLRRLVITCLNRMDSGHATRGPALDRLINALNRGEKATIGKILCHAESPDIWRFSAAPPRKTG